jgi:hypothetical protein
MNEVLRRVLRPLTLKQHPSTESGFYKVLCADSNFRHCKPVLSAWLAECPGYSDLHHLERHICLWCQFLKHELGDYVHSDKQHPQREHNLYTTLTNAKIKAADAELSSHHAHRGFNLFRPIPSNVNDLPNPDLLHTMLIGMLDPLQKWIFHFMKTHERLNKYNAIWLSVPAYHDLTPKNK